MPGGGSPIPRGKCIHQTLFSQQSNTLRNLDVAEDEEVDSMCLNYGRLFVMMDSLFSDFYLTEEHVIEINSGANQKND